MGENIKILSVHVSVNVDTITVSLQKGRTPQTIVINPRQASKAKPLPGVVSRLNMLNLLLQDDHLETIALKANLDMKTLLDAFELWAEE